MAEVKTEEKKSDKKLVEKPKEGTVVKFAEKIWVEATGKNKHMPEGKKYRVQKVHGERLIAMGAAKKTDAPEEEAK
jgi:hypothetical protein